MQIFGASEISGGSHFNCNPETVEFKLFIR